MPWQLKAVYNNSLLEKPTVDLWDNLALKINVKLCVWEVRANFDQDAYYLYECDFWIAKMFSFTFSVKEKALLWQLLSHAELIKKELTDIISVLNKLSFGNNVIILQNLLAFLRC